MTIGPCSSTYRFRIITILFVIVGLLCVGAAASAADLYIDANNGNDTTGDGTMGAPYQTWNRVRSEVASGDVVYLADGWYGNILEGQFSSPRDLFSNWVEVRNLPGHSPQVGRAKIGQNADQFYGPKKGGTFDAYLRFRGITFLGGTEPDGRVSSVSVFGARRLEFVDCRFETPPPWNGTDAIMETVALRIGGGRDLLVDNSEFTNTVTAVELRGTDIVLRNNTIHHISHDGIRVTAASNVLIEANHIYNLDDGADDIGATGPDQIGPFESWSRHSDGIHFFTSVSGVTNENITVRSNVLHDIESQAIQFNNLQEIHQNIVIENNVFGPARANVFNASEVSDYVHGLVFRNNSILYFPGGRTFDSIYRTGVPQNNYHVFISSRGIGTEVYNNIFVGLPGVAPTAARRDHNLIIGSPPNDSPGIGWESQITAISPYVAPGDFDGGTYTTSLAVDAGTRLTPTGEPIADLPATDMAGTQRDNRIDIGAYEVPGRSPAPEAQFSVSEARRQRYMDGFENGLFSRDFSIEDDDTGSLSWEQPVVGGPTLNDQHSIRFDVTGLHDRNYLSSPWVSGSAQFLITEQGDVWSDYELTFDVANIYMSSGAGPLVLARDSFTYYWIDIVGGTLYRCISGTRVQLATANELRIPASSSQYSYSVSVSHQSNGIQITVLRDAATVFSYRDDDPQAMEALVTGGIGFLKDSSDGYAYRIEIDNVYVEVSLIRPEYGIPVPKPSGIRVQ